MDDKTGSEQLFIHAEKNQDIEVENDETHWVGHDRTKDDRPRRDDARQARSDRDGRQRRDDHGPRQRGPRVVDKDETITIHANRSETVDKTRHHDQRQPGRLRAARRETRRLLSETHTVGVDETITVGGAQEITVGAVQTITRRRRSDDQRRRRIRRSTLAANQTINVGGNQTTNVGKNVSTDDRRRRIPRQSPVTHEPSIGKDDTLKVDKNLVDHRRRLDHRSRPATPASR